MEIVSIAKPTRTLCISHYRVVCTRVIPSEAIQCEVIHLEVLQVCIGHVPLLLQGHALDNVYWALVCELDKGNNQHFFHLKTSEYNFEVQYEFS